MKVQYLEGFDPVVVGAMEKMNVPGAAVAIVEDGKVVFTKAYGYSNLEKKTLLTEEQLLPIGSSSKAFTATAVVMLAADGALDLDQPIRNYIPGFELYDPIASKEATPRDLLCHRVGLPRHEPMWIGWSDMERSELVTKWLKHLKPNKPFRSKWEYQNHMFAVLGYLVECVSGKTWEDFVTKRIFKPLGIKNYSFRHPYDDPEGRYAKLYSPDDDQVNKEAEPLRFDAMGPAGSIILTIGDFAKWISFNMAGGKVGKKQLVDPALFAELHKPNMPYELLPFSFEERITVGYGFGWFIDSYRGNRLVEHGGNVNGGTAQASFLPDKGVGCVILSNADSSMFPDALSCEIFDRYLGCGGSRDWFDAYDSKMKPLIAEMKGQLAAILDTKVPDKPFSHELEAYAGTYHHGGYGALSISVRDGGLHLQYHDLGYELAHLHYDTFTFLFEQQMVMSLTFRVAPDGSIEALEIPFEMSMPKDPIRFVKEVAEKKEEEKEAEAKTGE